MAYAKFKYNNHQTGLRFFGGFFTLLFLIAAFYILINFGDFFEHDPISTLFILALLVIFAIPVFRKKGKEMRKDVMISKDTLIVGGTERYFLKDLTLEAYRHGDTPHYFLLYTKGKDFMIYTNKNDALMRYLLTLDITTEAYQNSDYKFVNNNTVIIMSEEGRTVTVNLDTGEFSLHQGEENPIVYHPKVFIQSPQYTRKG
jgi:hypothetical protein